MYIVSFVQLLAVFAILALLLYARLLLNVARSTFLGYTKNNMLISIKIKLKSSYSLQRNDLAKCSITVPRLKRRG